MPNKLSTLSEVFLLVSCLNPSSVNIWPTYLFSSLHNLMAVPFWNDLRFNWKNWRD